MNRRSFFLALAGLPLLKKLTPTDVPSLEEMFSTHLPRSVRAFLSDDFLPPYATTYTVTIRASAEEWERDLRRMSERLTKGIDKMVRQHPLITHQKVNETH